MKFRAAVYAEAHKPMVVDEVEAPDPGPRHVLTKLFASGICHSQLHQLDHPYMPLPALMGHEATGVVAAVGSEVTHVKEGDYVFVTWVPRDAKDGMAPAASAQATWRGKTFDTGTYTWAEYCLMEERYIVKTEPDIPTDVTAVIGCAVLTGSGTVTNVAKVQAGDSVAVFGAGGVGLCAVAAAAVAGARPLIVVDLDEAKLEFARRFGATHAINASGGDPVETVRQLTSGGADFAFDAIGVPVTQRQILESVRPGVTGLREGGTAVLIGVPGTESATLDLRSMVLGAKSYRASLGGTTRPERDFPKYLEWHRTGKLDLNALVTKRYKLAEINEAVDDLAKGRIFGRSIIEF